MNKQKGFIITEPAALQVSSEVNLIITGFGRHGKDTVSEFLEENYGLSFISSSMMACQLFLYDKIKERFGYQSLEECFADRGNHRKLWHDEIFAFNNPVLTALSREIYKRHPVYCGIRNQTELNEIKKQRPVVVVWVDAHKRHPPESGDSMSVCESDAHIILDNNGSLDDLHQNIMNMMKHIPKVKLAA